MSKLTDAMQLAFYKHTFQRYEILAPNIYLDARGSCEMDLMGIRRRSNYVDEIEIKVSRSDYLKDFKKTVLVEDSVVQYPNGTSRPKYKDVLKHEVLPSGDSTCNYFSFFLPKELADKFDDIPEYSGLYVYSESKGGKGYVTEVKSAPLLHKRKINEELKYGVGRKMAYRFWNMSKELLI